MIRFLCSLIPAVFLYFSFNNNAFAYPHFIAHGYNSCITCHYNPMGNGPVNDYGRAVGATMVSSRGFYDDNKPEDLIVSFSKNQQINILDLLLVIVEC